jgi:hypothetical protein
LAPAKPSGRRSRPLRMGRRAGQRQPGKMGRARRAPRRSAPPSSSATRYRPDPRDVPVVVHVTTETAHGVLAVPIEALLALSGGGEGVEVVNGGQRRIVAVTTGVFTGTGANRRPRHHRGAAPTRSTTRCGWGIAHSRSSACWRPSRSAPSWLHGGRAGGPYRSRQQPVQSPP